MSEAEVFEETRTEALILLRKELEEVQKENYELRSQLQNCRAEIIKLNYDLKMLLKTSPEQKPGALPPPSLL